MVSVLYKNFSVFINYDIIKRLDLEQECEKIPEKENIFLVNTINYIT